MRIVLVGSSGGHLAQLYVLRTWWQGQERHWVTFNTPDALSLLDGEEVTWAFHPTTRNLRNLLRNMRLAWRVLRSYRPDLVVSTGAAVAFPFFLMARAHRIATVFIEVYDHIEVPTLTGRLCYPLSDLFLIQWEEQRQAYPKAQLIGKLL